MRRPATMRTEGDHYPPPFQGASTTTSRPTMRSMQLKTAWLASNVGPGALSRRAQHVAARRRGGARHEAAQVARLERGEANSVTEMLMRISAGLGIKFTIDVLPSRSRLACHQEGSDRERAVRCGNRARRHARLRQVARIVGPGEISTCPSRSRACQGDLPPEETVAGVPGVLPDGRQITRTRRRPQCNELTSASAVGQPEQISTRRGRAP
jgi:hypothetical protein